MGVSGFRIVSAGCEYSNRPPMFRKFLSLLMISSVVVNPAMAAECHSHGEPSEMTVRPHIHIHSAGHDHFHDHHGQSRALDAPEFDDSTTWPTSHDSDVVYPGDWDSVVSPKSQSHELSRSAVVVTLPIYFGFRVHSDTRIDCPEECFARLAHALILKKIRLLL